MCTRRSVPAAVLAVTAALAAGCAGSAHRSDPTTSTTAQTAVPTTDPAGATVSARDGCANDLVTPSVLGGLTSAAGQPQAAELPGYTFYGNCGSAYYAVAALTPGPLAPAADSAGSAGPSAQYFTSRDGLTWTEAGTSGSAYGCGSFPVPAGLRALWGSCDVALHPEAPGPSAEGDQSACRQQTGSRTYARFTGVVVAADGSATIHAVPEEVHCGGSDDLQYEDAGAPQSLHLLSGAPVTIFDVGANRDVAEPIGRLAAYLSHPESGVFELFGDPPYLVTGVAEQFHP